MPSRVFVIQKSFGKNLTPALSYGKLVTIFEPCNVSDDIEGAKNFLRKVLVDFCDEDFLLAIGSPTAMILSGLIAAEINHGRCRLLEWDRQCFLYRVVEIDTKKKLPKKLYE